MSVDSPNREAEYDPERDRYRFEVGDDRTMERAVVESLAAVRRRSPSELDPIAYTVDLTAACDLVRSANGSTVTVNFTVDGFAVTLRGDRFIDITPP